MEISKEEEQRYTQLQMIALDFAREGNTQELESMLKHGLSVNLCTHKDDSLLMLATYNGNLETSKMLLNYEVDINKVNQRGQTPLEGVCFKGNIEIVKLLVESGAVVGRNALIYAGMFGHKEIVAYLKKHNFDNKQARVFGIGIELIVLITAKIRYFFLKKLRQYKAYKYGDLLKKETILSLVKLK